MLYLKHFTFPCWLRTVLHIHFPVNLINGARYSTWYPAKPELPSAVGGWIMTEFSIWLSFMYKCIHAIKDVSLTILRVTFPLFHAGLHAKHIIGEQSVLERSAPKSVQGMLPFEQRSQVSGSRLVQFHFFPSHHFPSLAPLSCQPRRLTAHCMNKCSSLS